MSHIPHIERRSERLRTSVRARCRTPDGDEGGVSLVNISAEGCCLDLQGAEVQPNQAIAIRLTTGGTLLAIVRWVADGQAGVEFDKELPWSVVRYLRLEHSNFMDEMRDFDFRAKRSVV